MEEVHELLEPVEEREEVPVGVDDRKEVPVRVFEGAGGGILRLCAVVTPDALKGEVHAIADQPT